MLTRIRRGGWAEAATAGFFLGGMTGALGMAFGLPFWSMIALNVVMAFPFGLQIQRRQAAQS